MPSGTSRIDPSVHRLRRRAASFFVGALLFTPAARAEDDPYQISVLTMGPGDHPFTKFGHNAILVEDAQTGTRHTYNYGAFAFDSLWLIPEFLLGRYRYWLAVEDYGRVLARYAAENRWVAEQRLDLTADEKRKIVRYLRWNAQEENRHYLYDYYRDNCSTRVRDVIDQAVGGSVKAVAVRPTPTTYRKETERLTADNRPVYFGLYMSMGSFIDRPLSLWDDMFLPSRLQEGLREVRVDRGGTSVPLVKSEELRVSSTRAPLRTEAPRWGLRIALIGGVCGAAIAGFGLLARRFSAARIALGAGLFLTGMVTGLLGCFFLFLWIGTNHEVAYHNENVLQLSPLALVLTVPAVRLAGGNGDSKVDRYVLAMTFMASLGLLLKVLPWFAQDNWHILAFTLPLWWGIFAATRLAAPRSDKSG